MTDYITPTIQARAQTRQIVVSKSLLSTAIVVSASKPLAFGPSGKTTFPYWKYFIGQRSFFHSNNEAQREPSRLP